MARAMPPLAPYARAAGYAAFLRHTRGKTVWRAAIATQGAAAPFPVKGQTLTAPSIRLKVPEYGDYLYIYEQRFDPHVVYWADDAPQNLTSEEYASARLTAQFTGAIIERIITLDGEPIGTVTARDFSDRTCQCTLGVVIAMPQYWGHGYGYLAIRQFLALLGAEGIGLVVLETYANNKRAQRCFQKLGFQKHRVFFAPHTGRFVVQMIRRMPPVKAIGEVIRPGDSRWKTPQK